ncbi:unnamed protein product, partial [Amoebophrya sp. A25]
VLAAEQQVLGDQENALVVKDGHEDHEDGVGRIEHEAEPQLHGDVSMSPSPPPHQDPDVILPSRSRSTFSSSSDSPLATASVPRRPASTPGHGYSSYAASSSSSDADNHDGRDDEHGDEFNIISHPLTSGKRSARRNKTLLPVPSELSAIHDESPAASSIAATPSVLWPSTTVGASTLTLATGFDEQVVDRVGHGQDEAERFLAVANNTAEEAPTDSNGDLQSQQGIVPTTAATDLGVQQRPQASTSSASCPPVVPVFNQVQLPPEQVIQLEPVQSRDYGIHQNPYNFGVTGPTGVALPPAMYTGIGMRPAAAYYVPQQLQVQPAQQPPLEP